ncbi:hypothetical protein IWQ62_006650, partial [Dispira parvispora]
KAAEMIAMANYQPREVFGIEFSHRFICFWHAVIPDNYMELIKGPSDLPPDIFIEMKRSIVLDPVLPDHRREFARAFLALMAYLNDQVVQNTQL